jgi:NAD(P)-dependent dehydrogenase (short-subunit alcohol dehydrogenase family)
METKVAIVTGASAGIGEATALALARRGYAVVLAARRADALDRVAAACVSAGGDARPHVTDVTDREQVDALVADTVERFGRLDVMVNNAGRGLRARVDQTTDEQMRALFEVNYFGVFYGSRAAARVMTARRSGHIFNVSSVIGKRGVPLNGAYCATKFAVCGLTDSMRVELKPHNVHVTAVCPTLTATEFFGAMEGATPLSGRGLAKLRGLMPADVVGRKIAATVGKAVPELVFSPGGKTLALVAAISPRMADAMMAYYHRRQMRGEA